MKKVILSSVLATATLAYSALTTDHVHASTTSDMSQLHTKNKNIVNQQGKEVQLKGVNAGNVFTTEGWLGGYSTGHHHGGYQGVFNHIQRRVEKEKPKMSDKESSEKTHRILEQYAHNRWSNQDFIRVHDMGFNTIRLPISFINITNYSKSMNHPEKGNHKKIDTSQLNVPKSENNEGLKEIKKFVERAKKNNLRVIIDMHKVPNEMNDKAKKDSFWKDKEAINKTLTMWKTISNEFKNEPAVAGYDILNEPKGKGKLGDDQVNQFYKSTVNAIRSTGDKHIIFLEGIWTSDQLKSPQYYEDPQRNLVYEYHEYPHNEDSKDKKHVHQFFHNNISLEMKEDNKMNVPTYFGEFSSNLSVKDHGYQAVKDAIKQMDKANVSWTFWNYDKQDKGSPWDIVHFDKVQHNSNDQFSDSDIKNFGKTINSKVNSHYYEFFRQELNS